MVRSSYFCATVGEWPMFLFCSQRQKKGKIGEVAEWSNAAVLKTVDCNRSGGSNPSLSALKNRQSPVFLFKP